MRDFKIYWNYKKNVPVIADKDSDNMKIKRDELKYLTSDIRPVFIQEKHLIKELFGLEDSVYYSSVWCSKQGKYIVDGKMLKNSAIQSAKGIKNIGEFREKIFSLVKIKEMEEEEKRILDSFVTENRDHLFYLLESRDQDEDGHYIGAYPFINQVIEKYPKRVPMVSFSGGKDSTAVSYLVRKALNNPSVLHIFGDTTLELPATYDYIDEFKKNNPMTPFFDEKNEENNFFEMCKEIGPPSRVMAWCCSIFKTGPMGTTLASFEEEFLTFYGVRRKESQNRSKYPKILESTKIDKQLSVSPVIDWLDLDIWLYIISQNLKFNFSYEQGFSRVGCWVCPHRGYWSDFVTEIYNDSIVINWKNSLYEFAKQIKKLDYKEYIDEEKWKLRRGGAGLNKVKKYEVQKKECVNEKNSYTFKLHRKLGKEFLELLKPFGKINYREKNTRCEANILSKNNEILFTVTYEAASNEVRATLVDLKDRYLYGKIMRQINKYNTCIYCQACNSTCSFGALSVNNSQYKIDENICTNCLKCVMHFESGCLIVSVLKIKKQEV
ncbi:phosphoadenosine phosphosulfate reductase family protein [uncultured Ilyobacter sp.]|uniref:phosphoadenosine phosphosulfate reductase domain-containing protein n=1 Tax=uncultured Ilyobacter sp. TaxID=544433 RepID=UPI0029F57D2E|nr:phosphoadenosine phosphosulfate reductase family protein [uncultured Ilyobacter sp.]